jgi:3-hydroxyisobutyrate dehydrogenase-like beta-hydroxyacid dehydrogenase
MAKRIIHVGPVGQGKVVEMINQVMAARLSLGLTLQARFQARPDEG